MAAVFLLAALVFGPLWADTSATAGPNYTAASIVNSASYVSGDYAPNAFITIFGTNLAYVTRTISLDDIHSAVLPTVLIGTGLRVLVNQIEANIYYVSPTQVNLLVPPLLVPGPATVQLLVDGLAGPAIQITLGNSAPAPFQLDATTVIAQHLDATLITQASPAHGGEVVVLYANGLGPTFPAAIKDHVPLAAALLVQFPSFQVWLNGAAVDQNRVLYAGVTPGFAGLYQINVRLPDDVAQNPEVRFGTSDKMSPPQRHLSVQSNNLVPEQR
jgi:uncharacterized protein (TIGR03437 family)